MVEKSRVKQFRFHLYTKITNAAEKSTDEPEFNSAYEPYFKCDCSEVRVDKPYKSG